MKHTIRRVIVLALLGCFISLPSFAQDIKVEGLVIDDTGMPLIGAKVHVKDQVITTNHNGQFEVEVPEGTKIKVKYPGLATTSKRASQKMVVALSLVDRISFNARAGLNLGALIANKDNSFDEHRVGFQIGVGMEYAFNQNWVLQPSVALYKKVYKDETTNINFQEGETPGINEWVADVYVGQFNLMAGYRWHVNDRLNLVFAVGPSLGYSFEGTLKHTLHHKDNATLKKYDVFEKIQDEYEDPLKAKLKEFDRVNFGIIGSVTAELDRFFFTLETGYEEHNTTALSFGVKF